MAIARTYACEECNHMIEVVLRSDQWDAAPPDCPACAAHMGQRFKPVAIGGSHMARAADLAEQIAAEDYHVANMQLDNREGSVPKVTYRDTTPNLPASSWQGNQEVLESAAAVGRASRLRHGSGLDMLEGMLKSGAQKDLIVESKRRSMKVW